MPRTKTKKRELILEILKNHGPLSIQEIHNKIPREHRSFNDSSIRGHCRTMLKEGLLKRTNKVHLKRFVYALPDQELPEEEKMPDSHRILFNPFSSIQAKIDKLYR